MAKVLFVDLPWKGKKYAGRAGMRWAHTSDKEPVISFRPFPFYLATTAAVLERKGHDVKVIDALAERLSEEQFYANVKEFEPEFIIAETHTPSYLNDCEIMRELKKVVPDSKLVFCGPHATALPSEVIKENSKVIDFVLVGEYEFLALKVVDGKQSQPVVQAQVREIDEIPWPARHLFKMKLYNEVFCRNYPNVQLMASRGCPFGCSYCNIYQMTGKRIQRCRNPEDVMREIEYIIDEYDPKEIYFDDDNIGSNQKWLETLMDLKIARGIKIPFTCMGHVSIKPEILEKMKKAGCVGIKLGIESADNEILKRLRKGITVEMAEAAVKKCKDLGIRTHLTYCIGLPGDTEETIKKTVEFAKSHGDHYQISIAAPFPGTPLWNEAKAEGWLNFKSWNDFDGMGDAIINYPSLPADKLKSIAAEAQSGTYAKVLKSGEWKKYLRMIYDERGAKGIAKLFFIRAPGMAADVVKGKFRKKK